MSTGVVLSTETNETGLYIGGDLRPRTYDLQVEREGFQRVAQRGIGLRVDDRLRVDVSLNVGQVSEAVEVTAEAPYLPTSENLAVLEAGRML